MLTRRAILILFVLYCAAFQPAFAEAPPTVTARAKNLDDFLAHPDWVNDYYEALKRKYGADRFPREGFDLVLGQLREMKEKVPGLKERLWQKGEGEAFSISLVTTNYGREVDMDKWKPHLSDMAKQLETQAGAYADMKLKEALRKSAELISKKNQEIREFNAKRVKKQSLTKEERAEVAEFYRTTSEDKALREAISFQVLQEVRSEGNGPVTRR